MEEEATVEKRQKIKKSMNRLLLEKLKENYDWGFNFASSSSFLNFFFEKTTVKKKPRKILLFFLLIFYWEWQGHWVSKYVSEFKIFEPQNEVHFWFSRTIFSLFRIWTCRQTFFLYSKGKDCLLLLHFFFFCVWTILKCELQVLSVPLQKIE